MVSAQSGQVNISIAVAPPYSTHISDYTSQPGKIMATLTNTSPTGGPVSIYLLGTISSTGGIRVYTSPEYRMPTPLVLYPGQPYLVTIDNLSAIFSENQIEFEGITKQEVLYGNGLPEDDYQICLQAFDYYTNNPVSGDAPQGCCGIFSVTDVEPPIILNPVCDDSIVATIPQVLTFTWTMPPGTPMSTQYYFKMVEILPSERDPNEALNTAGHPVFYETTVFSTSMLFGPAQPALVEGKKYAFSVTAIDPSGRISYRNNGASEVCSFVWKHPEAETGGSGGETGITIAGNLEIFVPFCNSGGILMNNEFPGANTTLRGNRVNNKVIQVNNTHDFYLRWEDKADALNQLNNGVSTQFTGKGQPVKGIVYKLEIYNSSNTKVWQKTVWKNPYYQQGMNGLPFVDNENYTLFVQAFTGTKTMGQVSVDQINGTDNKIAESSHCEFTYRILPDAANISSYEVTGRLLYKFQDYPDEYPMNSSQVQLVRYQMVRDTNTQAILATGIKPPLTATLTGPERYKVDLAEDGTFSVKVAAASNGGDLGYQSVSVCPPFSQAYSIVKGRVYEYFQLEVKGSYYLNPCTKVELSNDSLKLGDIVTRVYSYTLTAEIKKGYYSNVAKQIKMGSYEELNPKNVKVKVYRNGGVPADVPYYEGDIKVGETKIEAYQRKPVATGKVTTVIGADGLPHTMAVIDRLVCNFMNGDAYKIEITQDTVINGIACHYISDLWQKYITYEPSPTEYFVAAQNKTTNFKYKVKATLLSPDPPTSTVSGQLVYRDPTDPKAVIKPFANATVSLVLTYLIEDTKGHQTILDPFHVTDEISRYPAGENEAIGGANSGQNADELEAALKNPFGDGNIILATTDTKADGKFVFKDFAHLDSLGYRNASGSFGEGSGEFCNIALFNGKVKRTIRLVAGGQLGQNLFNPSNDISVQPLDSVNAGVLTAFLKTYELRVVPRSAPECTVLPRSGVVYGAKVKVSHLGNVQEEKYVDKASGCTFYGMMRHNNSVNWDDYKVEASTSDSVGENSYITRALSFPRAYNDWKRDTVYTDNKYTHSVISDNYSKSKPAEINKTYYQKETDFYFIKEDYKPVSVSINLYMEPKAPVISGRVLDASNTMRSVEEGKVTLFGKSIFPNVQPLILYRMVSEANQHGYFTFPGLDLVKKYQLCVYAKGYTLLKAKQLIAPGDTTTLSPGSSGMIPSNVQLTLKMGQQIHFPQILMMPNGTIKGWVTNENGDPVKAFIRTTRSLISKTKPKAITINMKMGEHFEINVPTYVSDTLFIIPEDLAYFTEAIPIPALTDQNSVKNLDYVRVKERRHRIRILIADKTTNQPVPGITVKVLDYSAVSSGSGYVEFNFKNASLKNFWFTLSPPQNSDYIETTGEFSNEESKDVIQYKFFIKTGYSAQGEVTTAGQPVPFAQVWVVNDNIIKRTTANQQGHYLLRGIQVVRSMKDPDIRAATLYCSGPADSVALPPSGIDFHNLAGIETKVNFPAKPVNPQPVNFVLTVFDKANLSQLHGFPMQVTSLRELNNGTFEISGSLYLDNAASNFDLLGNSQPLGFNKLIVKPDPAKKDSKGRPYLEANPGQVDFPLDKPLLKVRFEGTPNTVTPQSPVVSPGLFNYFVRLEGSGSNAFLRIQKDGTTGGILKSKARIVDNSFNFPGSYFRFEDGQFYFAENTNNILTSNIPVFSSNSDPTTMANLRKTFQRLTKTYKLTDLNGKDLKFRFLEFNAASKVGASYITSSGTIVIKPDAWTLNPLLKAYNLIDTIKINLPEIGITADGIVTGSALIDKIEIKFEKWDIVARNCEIGPQVGGIKSSNTEIQTGVLNIPIKEFLLRNDLIYLGQPDVKELSLGGIWTMKVLHPENAQFGLDPKVGKDLKPHYKICFVGDPAATVSGLPGFGAQVLAFQAVSLLSNGEQIVSFAPNSENMRFYQVADFKPVAIYSYADMFSVDGIMDLGIPRIPNDLTYKLQFTRKNNALSVLPVAQNITFDAPGYVKFASMPANGDKQLFEEGKLTLYGKVHEQPKLDPISIILTKKRTGIDNFYYTTTIERDPAKGNQFIKFGDNAGAGKFLVDSSRMRVIGPDWNILKLKLVPDAQFAASGFGTNAMHLAVFGEITTDPDVKNQSINVSGSSSPFGDFIMSFDWPNKRMVGAMNIQQKNMGGVIFGGAAETCVDPKGFYFAAAGIADVPSFGPLAAGVLVGSYTSGAAGGIPSEVQDLVTRFSVGKDLPCAIKQSNSFSGLFVTGRKSIPLLCYNVTVPLVVATASVYTDMGIEASAWAQFVGTPRIGVSAMLYAVAELKLNSITCTTLSARAEGIVKAQADIDLGTHVGALEACASINIFGYLEQGVPLLYGCSAPVFTLGSSSTPLFSMKALMSSSINMTNPGLPSFNVSLESGSCTDNTCEPPAFH
jgi:TANFOR domain-containing protein